MGVGVCVKGGGVHHGLSLSDCRLMLERLQQLTHTKVSQAVLHGEPRFDRRERKIRGGSASATVTETHA